MRLRIFSLILFSAFAFTSDSFSADTFEIDPAHSSATFSIRHIVSRVPGRFRELSGTIIYDTQDVTKSSVSARIIANSIDTGVEKRDNHLRSADFFDIQSYPEITFESRGVKRDTTTKEENRLLIIGTLTMHGTAKEITLPVEILGSGSDPWGNMRTGFEASITLNRKDFGINWNTPIPGGGLLVGDEVKVNIAIEAVKKNEEAKK